MAIAARQADLFEFEQQLPDGLMYRPDFISVDEETALLATIASLPLKEAQYRQYTARRRVTGFGSRYDYISNELVAAPPMPAFLAPLTGRVAEWLDIPQSRFVHALVTEYQKGTPIGWHRDAPHFETVVGISLAGSCPMRFRPCSAKSSKDMIVLDLEPRSAYVMRDPVRWEWHHSIPPARELRYSITFRTLCENA